MNVFGNQPVVVQQAITRRCFSEKNAKRINALGYVQLVAGILTIAFQVSATGIENTTYGTSKYPTSEFVGCGIWCGATFMTAGLLGVLAGKRNATSLIVVFLIFNILASVIACVLFGLSTANLAILQACPYLWGVKSSSDRNAYYHYSEGTYYYRDYFQDYSFCDGAVGRAWKAMDGLLLVLAILEFTIAVTSAVYCCRALSCCCRERAPRLVLQQSAGPAGTYLYGPSMQPIFLQQGSSVQRPVFTNPVMVAGPMGYSTGVSSAQLHRQFVHEAMLSAPINGASTSSGHYTGAATPAPIEQPVCKNVPNVPPNYYEISGFMQ